MADSSTSVVACSACGRRMRVASANLGKTVRCPACHASVPTRSEVHIHVERPEPQPIRRGDPARKHAQELMREARREERYRRADSGMPWYLWVLAALPWGIPVLTLGGCIPAAVAGCISAGAFAIARATRVPIVYRAIWLIAINGVAYLATIILLIIAFVATSNTPFSFSLWRPRAGIVPANSGSRPEVVPVPAQAEPPPKPKPHKVPPSAERVPGLIAYWDFDAKADGDRVKDQSGRGGDATIQGAEYTDGVRGQALQFNGRDAYCDLGSAPNLNFDAGTPFTIAGWVRTRATAGTIVSLRNSRDDGADIDITVEGGRIKGLVRQNGGISPTAVVSRTTVHDDAWHHFALSRSGEGEVELFVDGDSQGRMAGIQSQGAITTNLRALGSERYWVQKGLKGVNGASAYLEGSVDEVCIFDRILGAEEIQTLAGQ